MSNKMSFFKKVRLFFIYKKIVDMNREKILDKSLNLRIDSVYRIYTVLNMTEDVKTYGISVAERIITEYIQKMDGFFVNLNLSEYIGILDIEKVTDTDYLIVFGYGHFNTAKVMSNMIKLTIGTILATIGLFYLLF